MALKGTDIVKRLPDAGKKNCRECGFPTCFAFAMKLASAGVTLDKCPYLPADLKTELADALAPPIKLVSIGTGSAALAIGNEEVLYRHEKTFVHAPGIALMISDTDSDQAVTDKINKLQTMQFSWVGRTLKADLLAVQNKSGDKARFTTLIKSVMEKTGLPFVIISEDTAALLEAYNAAKDRKPLLYPVTKDNIDAVIAGIKAAPVPVAVRANNIEDLIPLTVKLKESGIEEIVLDPGSRKMNDAVRDQTLIRRAALKQNFRPLGYPTIGFPCFMASDKYRETAIAAMFVIKYPGVIVLSDFDAGALLPLLVQRLNVYTDPRMPMAVEEKIYEIGEPNADSPLLITSNWALTYFIVASEVEGSKVPTWLCVKNTDGLGVLTAWAAGKFGADTIGPLIKKLNVESKIKHKKLVIPGLASRIKGELEDALPGWEIIVGPKEASEIPGYLPRLVKQWKN
jgi:acetyl-CoA decarbonylase/synthase, CODH/ACS complex subunit gamma